MVSNTKVYSVSKTKQLIDLNGKLKNFHLKFKVSAGKPFDVLVVDQSTLDQKPDLDYITVDSMLDGEVHADKNVYQNYYMILKAQEPVEVSVELDLEPLPDFIDSSGKEGQEHSTHAKDSGLSTAGIVVCVLVLLGLLYYFGNSNSNSKSGGSGSVMIPPPATATSMIDKLRNAKFL